MSKSQFLILLEPAALDDIKSAINYYDEVQIGLGKKFERELNSCFISLEKAPFYSIRYEEVFCLPMTKFPFMIHYSINEGSFQLVVRAVLHTSLNPDMWKR
ncbi:MAG: type II toxin-antitoxin system RelE/ParE family toxin [Bacteroidia bacterium]